MAFIIGDIVTIGRYQGVVTKFFSDGTIGVDNNRVDPVLFRVDIIGHTLIPQKTAVLSA